MSPSLQVDSSPLSHAVDIFLEEGPVPVTQARLHHFLTAALLSLHPLPFLISAGLNLLFGTQGRSWRLHKVYFLQKKKRVNTERIYTQKLHRVLLNFNMLSFVGILALYYHKSKYSMLVMIIYDHNRNLVIRLSRCMF